MRAATGRPRVGSLEGSLVTVRPFRQDEFETVWREWAQGSYVRPARGPSRSVVRSRVEHSGRFHRGFLSLGIEVDERLVGDIQARGDPAQSLPPGVVELGIVVWDPADRGRGYGTEAVGLLTTWLFRHTGVERVQASTDVGNTAMRTSLEKLGFRLEDVMRGFMPAAEGRADYAMYAVLKDEWRGP